MLAQWADVQSSWILKESNFEEVESSNLSETLKQSYWNTIFTKAAAELTTLTIYELSNLTPQCVIIMNNSSDSLNTHFTLKNSGTSSLDLFLIKTTDTVQSFTHTHEVSPNYHPLQEKSSTSLIVTNFNDKTWEITDNKSLNSFPKGEKLTASTTSVLLFNTIILTSEDQTTFLSSQQLVTKDETADLSQLNKAKDHNFYDEREESDLDWVWDTAENDVDSENLSESEKERDLIHDSLISENLKLLLKANIYHYLPNCVTLLGVLWKQFDDWKIS